MKYQAKQVLEQPKFREWVDYLVTRARDLQLPHIDLLVDFSGSPNIVTYQSSWLLGAHKLLVQTPHENVSEEGPRLLRFDYEDQTQRGTLGFVLSHAAQQHRALVVLSDLSFEDLIAHFVRCVQIKWDDGDYSGILRFFDTRLFLPVINHLSTDNAGAILWPVQEWHWLNRDQNAVRLPLPADVKPPKQTQSVLQLNEAEVDALNLWHEAEVFRQKNLAELDKLGFDSQEALMQRLVAAQIAADQAQLFSEPERNRFLHGFLATPTG